MASGDKVSINMENQGMEIRDHTAKESDMMLKWHKKNKVKKATYKEEPKYPNNKMSLK